MAGLSLLTATTNAAPSAKRSVKTPARRAARWRQLAQRAERVAALRELTPADRTAVPRGRTADLGPGLLPGLLRRRPRSPRPAPGRCPEGARPARARAAAE